VSAEVDPPIILLVEDEVLLRWHLEETLRDEGYRLEIRTTGNEGLAAIEEGTPYDALVTNIRFADGPDGWALARRARELNPLIAVVYVSGDSAWQDGADGVERSRMIAKPFQPHELRKALASLVAS
jgi:CheY-like chemotaxis protein